MCEGEGQAQRLSQHRSWSVCLCRVVPCLRRVLVRVVPPETDVHLVYKVKWIKVIIGTPHKSSLRALSLVVEIGFLGPQTRWRKREAAADDKYQLVGQELSWVVVGQALQLR